VNDRRGLGSATVEDLIEAYRQAAAAHWRATLDGDSKTVNRHYDIIASVYRELRTRGRSGQSALVPLMHDPSKQLRCKAAAHVLEFAPDLAEPILVDLTTDDGLVGFTAMMALDRWRRGELSFP
jgi:hypothetical protein